MEKIAVAIGGGDIFGWNFKTKDDKNFEYNLRKVDEYIIHEVKIYVWNVK